MEYLYPLGFRTTGGSGSRRLFYCPSLVQFASNTNNYLVGTYLNKNNNFVDGIFIGNTGHGCGNSFEIDDREDRLQRHVSTTKLIWWGDFYWDFRRITIECER